MASSAPKTPRRIGSARTDHRTPEREPRLPHERDQSSDSQAPVPPPNDEIGAQAHEDVREGQVDTDRTAVTDELYGRTLRGTRGDPTSDPAGDPATQAPRKPARKPPR